MPPSESANLLNASEKKEEENGDVDTTVLTEEEVNEAIERIIALHPFQETNI